MQVNPDKRGPPEKTTAKKGPARSKLSSASFRVSIIAAGLALTWVVGLSFYKQEQMSEFAQRSLDQTVQFHPEVRNLYNGSFYFFFDEQFVPGISKLVREWKELKQIRYVSLDGVVLFDSSKPEKEKNTEKKKIESQNLELLKSESPIVLVSNFEIQIVVPSGQYVVFYDISGDAVFQRLWTLFLFGVLGILISFAFIQFVLRRGRYSRGFTDGVKGLIGLRGRFIATIIVINLITGGIVYFTLSSLQEQEETARIRKESILFSKFSTHKIISDFSQYYFFYFQDRFLPAMNSVIATNENLVGIKVISGDASKVIFDTEKVSSGPAPAREEAGEYFETSPSMMKALQSQGFTTRFIQRGGDRLLSVVTLFSNESFETPYLVEYLYTFSSLEKSVQQIRETIVLDLVPSMLIGMIIAILFAQFLISPIRKLSEAMEKVTSGDYGSNVEVNRTDEIGELIESFNMMTSELKKKTELRKYLSDSTYRRIMAAPDTQEGARLKGARLNATVLFSDIRGFVSICETMDAEEITRMLSDYFTEMVEVIYKYGGEVDKFIGDALLAVFYDSEEDGGDAPTKTSLQAIYCALEMKERLGTFNSKRAKNGKREIQTGIGIAHGQLISGPIGSKDRMDFTVIGDVVNLSSRIEKESKQGKFTKILFENNVEKRVRGLLEYHELEMSVRGKEDDVRVFELIRVRDLEKLIQNLESDEDDLVIRSIELLGQSRNEEALDPLLKCLNHPSSEDIRVASVMALTKLALPEEEKLIEAFFLRLRIDKSDRVTSALISAVGKVCRNSRILELHSYLSSKNLRIVANAVEAIAQSKQKEATDLILPMLSSRNNRVKANAAMGLFAAGHYGVVDTLKPMLLHSDPLMRSSAAFALGELTRLVDHDHLLGEWKSTPQIKSFIAELQECVPMLVTLLKDNERVVKRQAILSLGKIRDKTAVLPLIQCIDWEKEDPELIVEVSDALRAIGTHKLVREVLDRI